MSESSLESCEAVVLTQATASLSNRDDKQDLPAGKEGLNSYKAYVAPSSLSDKSDEAVLDWFHSTVPIGCLEDFEWDVWRMKEPDAWKEFI